MPILGPEETGAPTTVRWPTWAVVATVLVFAAIVYIGFHYMRGRYLVGGSADWTLLALAGNFSNPSTGDVTPVIANR